MQQHGRYAKRGCCIDILNITFLILSMAFIAKSPPSTIFLADQSLLLRRAAHFLGCYSASLGGNLRVVASKMSTRCHFYKQNTLAGLLAAVPLAAVGGAYKRPVLGPTVSVSLLCSAINSQPASWALYLTALTSWAIYLPLTVC